MQRATWFRLLVGAGLALCIASFFLDDWTMAWVRAHRIACYRHAASFVTRWGDFGPLLSLVLMLFGAARLARSEVWSRRFGLMLISAVASGLLANLIRATVCRTRPEATVPAGWYGLDIGLRSAGFRYQYSSFPSAHTAVAFGAAIPLLFLARRGWAIPGLLLAATIGASRVYLNAHHLSDVVAGAYLGGLVSWVVCFKVPLAALAGRLRIAAAGLAPQARAPRPSVS